MAYRVCPTIKKILICIWSVVIFSSLISCGLYSFTPQTGPIDAKTIVIKNFQNKATTVNPALGQNLTELLRKKFISETKLAIIDADGDWNVEGEITGYNTSPVAAGAQQAELNRLTIAVKINFTDNLNKKNSWVSSFSRFSDFAAGQNLSDVEDKLTEEINDQLVIDIFNKIAVNW